MKRLTHIDHIGWYVDDRSTHFDERTRGKDVDRLASYEDTGLEPEEIQRMKEYMKPFTIRDIDRFNEIMQAEKDGRVVVLPPNDPLTMEELREMDGEPVWTVALDYGASRWAFVSADCEVVRYFTTRRGVACDVIGRHFRTYGKTWLAYRRKPEGG